MFNPNDFLIFSRSILDCANLTKNESLYRTAISRSYYASFLTAREKIDELEPHQMSHLNANSHEEVTRALWFPRFFTKDPDLSDDLAELKRFRIEADYHFPNAQNSPSGERRKTNGR